MDWIMFSGRIHALRPDRTKRTTTLCGISPLDVPKVVAFELGEIPGGPVCERCMIDAALASAEEEPLGEAMTRGFVPADQSF